MASQKNNNGYHWTSLNQFYESITRELGDCLNKGNRYEGVVITGNYDRSFLENLRKEIMEKMIEKQINLHVFTFSSREEARNLDGYLLKDGKKGFYFIDFDWFLSNAFNQECRESILNLIS